MNQFKYFDIIWGKYFGNIKYIIFFLQLVTVVLETLSIALLLPILHFLTGVEIESKIIKGLENFLKVDEINFDILKILLFILAIFFFKSILLSLINWFQIKITTTLQKNLAKKLVSGYLNISFNSFINRNTSDYIRNVIEETSVITTRFALFINLSTEVLVFISISSILLYYDLKSTLYVLLFFLFVICIYYLVIRKYLIKLGQIKVLNMSLKLKTINEIFNSWKLINVIGKQKYFVDLFHKFNRLQTDSSRNMNFITTITRLWIEVLLIISLIIFVFTLSLSDISDQEILLKLGVLFTLCLRLTPSINRIINYIQKIKFGDKSLEIILEDLTLFEKERKLLDETVKNFSFDLNENLILEKINFTYKENNKKIFENLNLQIKKNNTIGVLGKTGVGKTTLIDLIIGFLKPAGGFIKLGDKNIEDNLHEWQSNIGYVPQSIYLLDESIKFNITLEEDQNKVDEIRFRNAINVSQLSSFIENQEKLEETMIGENGIKLSGGQKQRIGIARALYREPKILILDEPSNNLDQSTSKLLFEKIKSEYMNIRVIIISHNILDFNHCDEVYKVEDYKISKN
tara:strand:- start:1923 stop:3644 length:1722 start_codon:yes stop_codon:yes gene_type:complete